jgi:hypothetical protein
MLGLVAGAPHHYFTNSAAARPSHPVRLSRAEQPRFVNAPSSSPLLKQSARSAWGRRTGRRPQTQRTACTHDARTAEASCESLNQEDSVATPRSPQLRRRRVPQERRLQETSSALTTNTFSVDPSASGSGIELAMSAVRAVDSRVCRAVVGEVHPPDLIGEKPPPAALDAGKGLCRSARDRKVAHRAPIS